MNLAYQHLALAEVQPGMVLSDVLLDRQGQVLLPQGAVLTAAIIALLPRHGIDRLPVLRTDDAAPGAPAIDETAVTQRLDFVFRRSNNSNSSSDPDSAGASLHAYMRDYRLGREVGA